MPFFKFKGVTLLELCIAMMVMSVLSVGVASLVRSGVESQMNDRMYNLMHLSANRLTSDLRFDLSRANGASINGTGSQLTVTQEDGSSVRYEVYIDPAPGNNAVNSIRRVDVSSGTTKIYNRIGNAEYRPVLRVTCDGTNPPPGNAAAPCFSGRILQETPAGSGTFLMVNNSASPTQVQVADISFYSPSYTAGNDLSYLRAFGAPRYRLQGSSFDVLSNMQFN